MEHLKLELFNKAEHLYYPIGNKNYLYIGIFEYISYHKTEEITKIQNVGTKGLLSFNIPAFCLN